jgi:hypothetical protein
MKCIQVLADVSDITYHLPLLQVVSKQFFLTGKILLIQPHHSNCQNWSKLSTTLTTLQHAKINDQSLLPVKKNNIESWFLALFDMLPFIFLKTHKVLHGWIFCAFEVLKACLRF